MDSKIRKGNKRKEKKKRNKKSALAQNSACSAHWCFPLAAHLTNSHAAVLLLRWHTGPGRQLAALDPRAWLAAWWDPHVRFIPNRPPAPAGIVARGCGNLGNGLTRVRGHARGIRSYAPHSPALSYHQTAPCDTSVWEVRRHWRQEVTDTAIVPSSAFLDGNFLPSLA